jgi:hypothetical protein
MHTLLETVPNSLIQKLRPSQLVVASHKTACDEALAEDNSVYCVHTTDSSAAGRFSREAWSFVEDPDSCAQLPDVWVFEDDSVFTAEKTFGSGSSSTKRATDELDKTITDLLASWEHVVRTCDFDQSKNVFISEGNGGEVSEAQSRVTSAWFLN